MNSRILAAIAMAGVCFAAELAAPPATPKKPVADEYFGVKVPDDFRWLENFDDPAVKAWSAAENRRSRGFLDALPARPAILARLNELYGDAPQRYVSLIFRGDRLFALKRQPPKEQALLVTLNASGDPGSERVVVDPNTLDPQGATSIDFHAPSLDGKYAAVSLSRNGSEDGTVRVFDTATGRELSDTIPRVNGGTAGGSVTWNADGSGFYYTRYPRPGERPPVDLDFYQQVYFHRLGTPVASDQYARGKDLPRIAEIALATSDDGKYVLATVANGDGGEYLHYVLLPGGRWKQVTRLSDRIIGAAFGEDDAIYLLSRLNAPLGKILRAEAPDFDIARARVAVPPGRASIVDFVATSKGIYVSTIAGGPSELRIFLGTRAQRNAAAAVFESRERTPPRPVRFEPPRLMGQSIPIQPVSAVGQLLRAAGGALLFENETYLEPPAWYRYDAGEVTRTALHYDSKVDFSDCEVLRRFAVSKDGTRVPLNILRKKGTKLDGANPVLLYGYGGYGISLTPHFEARNRLWLDHGGIYVVANVRGGSEYGEPWHEQGRLTRKQNVFDDFIASAEYLIKMKYTNPAKLAIEGASNGGLLMGAALTERPDLFRAVVAHVGIYDMLRVELSPNGAFNVTEFGTVKEPDEFKALHAYSPYHHVKDGTEYPAVLFLTGERDKRVDPMQSRKMTARLQAAGPAKGPILLRTSSNSGHGFGTALSERIEQDADVFAFLFQELGMR
ncbi:MAG: prolyl oligopeptidase family serine peptidase [Bryobacteraceae bacterium]